MNGGTFTPGVEKIRPGIYFNFQLRANDRISSGARGRTAIPLVLSWGPAKQIVEISNENDASNRLGVDMTDPSLALLCEAKKRSSTVLAYRVNEGVKATAELGANKKVKALHGGLKGNDIQIVIGTNILDETKKDVTTYFGTRTVDTQTVEKFEDLNANSVAVFEGSGELEDTAGIKLSGGADGTVKTEDYTGFLTAAESENFDTIGLPGVEEEALKTTFASFIRRLREEQGIKVQGVISNYPANYEGIISVRNGVLLSSGQELTPAEAVAWVAGASAGATLRQSNTFMQYEGAIDALPRLEHDEIEAGLQNGEFIFTFNSRDRSVTVEQDINSSVGTTKLRKNKIIRILDAINNDITNSLKETIRNRKSTGIDIPANADGASIVKTAVAVYLNELQDNNIIQNFDLNEDVTVEITNAGDGFLINVGVQPVDSAEKFYFDVEVV